MKQDKVIFFDTTLRDGEQCPGASMNLRQKLEVARQLEKLGVDVIEAGFPVASEGDFESVSTIARTVKKCRVAGLARCTEQDIRKAAAAVAPAGDRARIHVFWPPARCTASSSSRRARRRWWPRPWRV